MSTAGRWQPDTPGRSNARVCTHDVSVLVGAGHGCEEAECQKAEQLPSPTHVCSFQNGAPTGRAPFTRMHEREERIPPARCGDGGQSPYRYRNVLSYAQRLAVTTQPGTHGDTRWRTDTYQECRNDVSRCIMHTAAVDTRQSIREATSPIAPSGGTRTLLIVKSLDIQSPGFTNAS